ncbi:MAG: serine/threonine-protein phosphatase, partial [Saprospiraceae bacterium]|nr:serine/threonine-protein phosphatase [Saprospiraceae bacterium]
HSRIGGDYYDVIPHPTENSFYVAIADVSGKGVSAALIMASFQATLRSVIRTDLPFKKFAQHLNSETFRITMGEKFITLFVAKVNLEKRRLEYWNAGHNPPILKRDDALAILTDGSTLLGAFPKLPTITLGVEPLGKFNTLFTYTDGLTDLINDSNERFRLEGLLEFMSSNQFDTPAAFNKELRQRLEKYKGTKDFDDDITFLTTIVQ